MTPTVLILLCICLYKISLLNFKTGYYEQILKNNRDKFSENRYSKIEKVMKKKTPF